MLVGRLAKHAQEAEGREVSLHVELDVALTRAKALEEELPGLCQSKEEDLTKAWREIRMELENSYRAMLDRLH